MKLLAIAILAIAAQGATLLRIDCGGTGGPGWATDAYFTGGTRWTSANQASMSSQPVPYSALRYPATAGGTFSYALPISAGSYLLTLRFIEPNKTAAGQRVFSVSVNGAVAIDRLDLFATVGLMRTYDRSLLVTSDGTIRIDFTSNAGNAVISGIQIDDVPPPPPMPTVAVLDGPDACDAAPSMKTPGGGVHFGGHLCAAAAVPPNRAVGTVFRDANFGGISQVLSPATFTHGYSFPSPVSATNRYVAISDTTGLHFAVDRTQPGFTTKPIAIAAPLWDVKDDDIYYSLSGAKVMRNSVAAGTSVAAADFTGTFTAISNGGSSQPSADGWIAFWSDVEHQVCAFDTASSKVYCGDFMAPAASRVPYSFIDFVSITNIDKGSNKRYVVMFVHPAMTVFSVNLATGKLDFENRGGEWMAAEGFNNPTGNGDGVCDPGENCLGAPHGTVTSVAGIQYIVTVADTASTPCERDLVYAPIAAGIRAMSQRITVLPLGYCSSAYEWPDFHVGCTPVTGACVLSTLSPTPSPYGNQVILIKDPLHVTKLALSSSRPSGADGYWYSPRAALSPDGRYVVYDSNFGGAPDASGYSKNQVLVMSTTQTGIITPVAAPGVQLAKLERCSGSGKGWDCAGIVRALFTLTDGSVLEIYGADGNAIPPAATKWTPIQ